MPREDEAADHEGVPLHFRIVHGRPTATEVAALTTVLTALACRTASAERPGGGTAPRRADWDRGWLAHPPPGSWRARLGLPPRHH